MLYEYLYRLYVAHVSVEDWKQCFGEHENCCFAAMLKALSYLIALILHKSIIKDKNFDQHLIT